MDEADDKKLESRFGFNFNADIEGDGWLTSPDDDDMFGEEDAFSVDSGAFLPNDEGRTEFLPPDPDRIPVIENAVKQQTEEYKQRPAIERTRELFGYMRPQRIVLLGIIKAAAEPISNTDIAVEIERLKSHKFSVYSPTNLCTMLEQAGSLDRVTAEGEPYAEKTPEPEIVIVDGIEYYKPTYPEEVYWVASEAGNTVLGENDPLERAGRLFESEKEFRPIYKSVLELLIEFDGAAMTALSGAIDSIPAIATPRRFFVQHFVENLERCEAAEWDGSTWKATELGKQLLEKNLADVESAEITPVNPDGTLKAPGAHDGRLITETQGVNW